MLSRSKTPTLESLYVTLKNKFFSTNTNQKLPNFPKLSKIPAKYRSKAILQAQEVLTDYFHNSRSLPFCFAEYIGKNSRFSLLALVSKVPFSRNRFPNSIHRFLRYHPINEFEFFFESIGINHVEISSMLHMYKCFLCEDSKVFDAACALACFGFPWNKLCILYKGKVSIFSKQPYELEERLSHIELYGFGNTAVIGICLAFPHVLGDKSEDEIDMLFDDLKRVFLDFDLASSVEGNVDAWFEICRKIAMFYELGCEKGKIGELMGRNKSIFVDYSEEVLAEKIDFFCRLDVRKEEVGLLVLSKPEILSFDLEVRVISTVGFLKHFGMGVNKRKLIAQTYQYVMGRNRIANVPHVLRSLDLSEWFFDRLKNDGHGLLGNYVIGSVEDFDEDYAGHLQKIQASRTPFHTLHKLDFLHGIGFGENKLTMKVLSLLHGPGDELQERFDCLLRGGINFSTLCKMLTVSPKILNQKAEFLEQKLKFLFLDMGLSQEELCAFPSCLCYDLEKRIRPRCQFHKWLREQNWCPYEYSLASIVGTSDKMFMARISDIHPDAPKKWFDSFLKENESISCQGTSEC
ncbi:transcription termination factor MTEF18, mitochondrial [Solanum dulcamara]|uniref:transcription termination factor MTEF18, mitochondrial n=1 Tax=Solanum dulcamara TaxID=45834 RepID=UPI0024854570|nr:transcription termination factor MTEF18, mitochondrial [Solanum dulcamara]